MYLHPYKQPQSKGLSLHFFPSIQSFLLCYLACRPAFSLYGGKQLAALVGVGLPYHFPLISCLHTSWDVLCSATDIPSLGLPALLLVGPETRFFGLLLSPSRCSSQPSPLRAYLRSWP